MTSTLAQHFALLPEVVVQPKPERAPHGAGRERCTVEYLDAVLAKIPPDILRNTVKGEAPSKKGWLQVLGAFIEADVIRKDGTVLPYDEVVAKLEAWSQGGGSYDPDKFAADCEWFARRRGKNPGKSRAGLGTVDALARAAGYAGLPPSGVVSPFAPVQQAANDPQPSGVLVKPEGLYDGDEMANRPKASYLVGSVLQENSHSNASGRPGAGKSLVELALALSVCTGKSWLGMPVKKTGVVLWVAAETQERVWSDVLAWCKEFAVDPKNLRGSFFIFDRSARLNTQAGRDAFDGVVAWIKHATGRLPIYSVFDTLRRNMAGGVSEEKPTSEVLHRVSELQGMGIAVTLVAHQPRSAKEGEEETKGLTDWDDAADHVRIYTGKVRDNSTVVRFAKIRSAEDEWSVVVGYKQHVIADGASAFNYVAASGRRRDTGEAGNTTDKQEKAKTIEIAEKFTALSLDPIVVDALAQVPGSDWSDRSFADHLAVRDDVPWGSSQIRKFLPILRETKGTMTHKLKLYDTHKRRWISRPAVRK